VEVTNNIVCDIVIDDKKKNKNGLWDSSKILRFSWYFKYKVSTFKPNTMV
jgi:hypothetical protein